MIFVFDTNEDSELFYYYYNKYYRLMYKYAYNIVKDMTIPRTHFKMLGLEYPNVCQRSENLKKGLLFII